MRRRSSPMFPICSGYDFPRLSAPELDQSRVRGANFGCRLAVRNPCRTAAGHNVGIRVG